MNNDLKLECIIKFNQILEKDSITFKEFISLSNEVINEYNQFLNIGKIELESCTPVNIYDSNKVLNITTLFDAGTACDTEPIISQSHQVGQDGSVNVKVYPIKGKKIGDTNLEDVKIIVNNLFLCASRLRFMELLSDARSKDQLTGINNMIPVMGFGKQLQARHMLDNFTILYGNIKEFKNVNRTYGTGFANKILQSYYRELVKIAGENIMVGRPGGDNIICVLPTNLLDDFLKKIKAVTFECCGLTITLESYSGCYSFMENDEFENGIEYATDALINCKKKKLSSYCYTTTDIQNTFKEKKLKDEFIEALAKNELVVYFQPKVRLNNFTMCGAEALVRWVKNGELITPNEFIPIIEKMDLIYELDFYMLDKTCKAIKAIEEAGITPVTISVNFSTKHSENKNTAERIIEIVNRNGVNPALIEIEITELSSHNDIEEFSSFVTKLKNNGFGVTMDDFGSGYASIEILKKIDYDVIKVDKSLMDDITNVGSKEATVDRKLIDLLKCINKSIVFEGVETEEQIELLENIGCDIVQGYYFDKPLTLEDFTRKLTNPLYSKEKGKTSH